MAMAFLIIPKEIVTAGVYRINAGIVTTNDMEALRARVASENSNRGRIQILRRLVQQAIEIRSQES